VPLRAWAPKPYAPRQGRGLKDISEIARKLRTNDRLAGFSGYSFVQFKHIRWS